MILFWTATAEPISVPPWATILSLCLLVVAAVYIVVLRLRMDGIRLELKEGQQDKVQALIKEEKLEVESQRTRDAFLANISHELRTPLNVIIGYAELVEEICAEEQANHLIPDIRKINSAGRHLQTIINDMLELSKIEAGMMETRFERCPTPILLNSMGKAVKPVLEARGNKLDIYYTMAPEEVEVDVLKIRQVITHLIFFANRHIHHGTIQLSLEEEHEDGMLWLVFTVADNGLPVTHQVLEALSSGFAFAFEDKGEDKDLGMGLAISRSLASIMGGSLEAGSQQDGNRLVVRLPAVHARIHGGSSHAEDTSFAGKSVQLISDDSANLQHLGRALSEVGYVVYQAFSQDEGMANMVEHAPDVVVIDGMMPHMEAWHTMETIKASKEFRQTPVIMTSLMDEVSKTYALGAIGFLNKPVREARLLQVLERYLGGEQERHILLVEDDRVSRKIMAKMLEKARWQVREAENGQRALEQVKQQRPNLVLLDLMMPEMGGYDFFSELRKQPEWETIPVVFVSSAHVTAESKLRIPGRFTHVPNQGDFSDPEFCEEIMAQIRLFLKSSHVSQNSGVSSHG